MNSGCGRNRGGASSYSRAGSWVAIQRNIDYSPWEQKNKHYNIDSNIIYTLVHVSI